MPIDNAEKRRAISGIPFLVPGVTPNASKDAEWRREAAWGYYYEVIIPVYIITDEPLDLAAHSTLVQLDSPLDSVMTNYIAKYTMVDHEGKTLKDHAGNTLIFTVSGQVRTDIVDLGA